MADATASRAVQLLVRVQYDAPVGRQMAKSESLNLLFCGFESHPIDMP